MRWFSRRTETPTRGRHAAGSQSEPVPVVAASPLSAPMPALGSGVHLGFGDGSALELGIGDSRAATFRALADSLAQGVR